MTLRRVLLLPVALLAALLVPSTALSEPLPAPVVTELDRIASGSRYANSTWGIAVADATTGEALYGRNAAQMFVPGSVMKSFSITTALSEYGTRYRFRTPVHRVGAVRDGVLRGDLVLVASGDFSFGLRERRDGTLEFNTFDHNEANSLGAAVLLRHNPLRVLDRMAARVRASGIRRVAGDVAIDDRLFEAYRGWPDGVIAPIWVNENLIDVTSIPTRPGRPAGVTWRPRTAAYRVVSNVVTAPKGAATTLDLQEVRPGVLRLSGRIAAGSRPSVRNIVVGDPPAFARTAFIEALGRAGVRVDAPVTGPNPVAVLPPRRTYPASTRLAQHVSPRFSEFTKVVLKTSYNRGADLMLCLAAVRAGSRDCPDGIARQQRVLRTLGVPTDQVFAFDGAGSDDRDRFTLEAVTALNRAVAGQPYGAAFRDGLPVLGVSGDLAIFGRDSPARGKLQAKTGTRAGTTGAGQVLALQRGLSGYLTTASGRELLVSIFLNDFTIGDFDDLFAVIGDQVDMVSAIHLGM